MTRYEGSYLDDYMSGRPHHYSKNGEHYPLADDTRVSNYKTRNNNHGVQSASADPRFRTFVPSGPSVPSKRRSTLFSNQGPAHHGDGRDASFGKHKRPAHELRPFSSFMPFSVDSHPKAVQLGDEIKRAFHEANPGIMPKEGHSMDYIYRSWAQTPDRPLSEVHRYHAFQKMLECGSVDEISAEVFHFLCGIHQCKYGDGFMRDDMQLCDCDGKVSRCFVAAYIELARKLHRTEKKLSEAYRVTKQTTSRPGAPGHNRKHRMLPDLR
ncbi:MAG: hypothetical protein STHCBS139747_004007 [Sporothrix thermara]